MENSNVSDKIKDLRKSLGLSQEEFALPLGVKQATISAIENKKAGYSMQLLKKICETYKIDLKYFFDGNEKDTLRDTLLEFRGYLKAILPNDLWQKIEPNFPKYRQVF